MFLTVLHIPSVSNVISEVQLGTYTTEPKPTSSVYKHFTNKNNHDTENISSKVTIAVIAKDRDPVNLRLKEAFHIRKQKPDINSCEKRSELTDYYVNTFSHSLILS